MAAKPSRFYRLLAQVIDKLDIPIVGKGAASQSADLMQLQNSAGTSLFSVSAAGVPSMPAGSLTEAQHQVASAIGLGLVRFAHAKYDFAVDGGVQGAITPASTGVVPAKAILLGGVVNPTTAVTSLGSATVSIGTTAGSSAASILAATAKASLSLQALLNAVPVFATPVKMTAAGSINITVGTADLTAGVIEIFVLYVLAQG